MQKKKLIGKKVSTWGNYSRGLNGTIKSFYKNEVTVDMDHGQCIVFFDWELYFPDHPLGYNQPCFDT